MLAVRDQSVNLKGHSLDSVDNIDVQSYRVNPFCDDNDRNQENSSLLCDTNEVASSAQPDWPSFKKQGKC